ncbi:unnamed protein product, partial [Polarella glacialis]
MFQCSVIGGALAMFVGDSHTRVVGMSGGVYGLLGMHLGDIIINPRKKIARQKFAFLIVIGAVDILTAMFASNDSGVSFTAHFGGWLSGLLIAIVFGRNLDAEDYVIEKQVRILSFVLIIGLTAFAIGWWTTWAPMDIFEQVTSIACLDIDYCKRVLQTRWCWARQIANVLSVSPRFTRLSSLRITLSLEYYEAFDVVVMSQANLACSKAASPSVAVPHHSRGINGRGPLFRAGKSVDVATQLNAAVATAFAGRPNLWCFSSDDDEACQAAWLAGILEVERQGVAATVAAWQALRLPTAASAAVAALRSLASPIQDGARHLGLEVKEDTVLQALQAYRNGWLQPQEGAFDTMQRPEAPKLRAELFQALMFASSGPDQLASELRVAADRGLLPLDGFARILHGFGLPIAQADLLEVGRSFCSAGSNGSVDVATIAMDYNAWLRNRALRG